MAWAAGTEEKEKLQALISEAGIEVEAIYEMQL